MCFILFDEPSTLAPNLQELPKQFEKDPVQFVYVAKGEKGYNMKDALFGGAQAVIYKPKR